MGLNIIAGRAKTGKSTYVYDSINKEIKRGNSAALLLIVPEQMTYQAEYEIIDRIGDQGIMDAEVLSFTRLGYKVFEEVGGLKVQEINSYGKIMLLKQIFEENKDQLKLFTKASRQEGFLREFDALISELKQDCISVEFLEQVIKHKVREDENQLLTKKLEDIIKIYGEIKKRTEGVFFDEEDKKDLLISAVQHSSFIKNSRIWIDGFESFNMQRHRLIKELIKYAGEVYITLDMDSASFDNLSNTDDWEAFSTVHSTYKNLIRDIDCKIKIISLDNNSMNNEMKTIERNIFSVNPGLYSEQTNRINILSSLNPYTETESAAAKIISLVRDHGYRWKDIAVATGDMDTYGINIKKVFTQYEIPHFLDYKRDIMGNPLTKFILSLLDIFIYNFRHDSVFELLKTGFYPLDYDEVSRMENFALQYGIKGDKWFRPFAFNAENIDYFNSLREKFASGFKNGRKKFRGLKTTLDITMFLFDFMKEYKVQEKIEKQVEVFKKSELYELSGENAQIWNYVIDILEQIVLAGGDIEITPAEYRKMIEAGFNEVKISIIPPTLDKVTVSDIEKASIKPTKVLFILGANEGSINSGNSEKGLLLDEEREILAKSGMNMLNNSDYYLYREKHILYKLFTCASDHIFLSWAQGTAEGRALQASIYADKFKQLFPAVKEQSDLNAAEEDKVSNSRGTAGYLIAAVRDFVEGKGIDSIWRDVYAWYEKNEENMHVMIKNGLLHENKAYKITSENLKKIHNAPVSMSVSKLENFAACPFKFFMDGIIKPRPRIVQKVEFYDLGNIYHQAVEQFTKHITEDTGNIDNLNKDEIYLLSQSCAEKILDEGEMDYTALNANQRSIYMKEKIKRLIGRVADTIVEQLKKGNFRPACTELVIGEEGSQAIEPLKIKISDDVSVLLQGRIDRVDTLQKDGKTYINIIDYKSSYKDIDLSDAVQGLQLQLLVYMSAIIRNGEKLFRTETEIGGAYYFCIDDPLIDGDEVLAENSQREIFRQLSLKGYIVEDADIISNMDREIAESRKSDVIPVSLNKDGSTSKSSKTLTVDEFRAVLDKTDSVAADMAEKIMDGNIDIIPFKKEADGRTPCQYCEYMGVCQFDLSVGNSYRKIKKLKKDDILSEILEEGGANA